MVFEAVKDFWSPELRSAYVAGRQYTVHPWNAKLANEAREWAKDGRIQWVDDQAPRARISGVGTVR